MIGGILIESVESETEESELETADVEEEGEVEDRMCAIPAAASVSFSGITVRR